MFRKFLAFVLGHTAQLQGIAKEAVERLGVDFFTISDDERRDRIVAVVKRLVNLKYPQFSAYSGVIIDLAVKYGRELLDAHKKA